MVRCRVGASYGRGAERSDASASRRFRSNTMLSAGRTAGMTPPAAYGRLLAPLQNFGFVWIEAKRLLGRLQRGNAAEPTRPKAGAQSFHTAANRPYAAYLQRFCTKIPLAFYASGIPQRIRAYGGGERSGTTRFRKQGGIKAALSAPGRLCDPILIRKMKKRKGTRGSVPPVASP